MFFFDFYGHQIIKRDLINTFFYNDIKQIPSLKTIILNLGYQKSNIRSLISSLLALELISTKKSKLTKSKRLNIIIKVKKGTPVGCKVILKKKIMGVFYFKLITCILPKIKQFQNVKLQKKFKSTKSISVTIKNPLLFMELENQYQFFKDIPKLDIVLLTNSKSSNEFFFLLKSIKFFFASTQEVANVTQFGRV